MWVSRARDNEKLFRLGAQPPYPQLDADAEAIVRAVAEAMDEVKPRG